MADLSQGKLTLQNEVDGMEHIFDIKGIGRRPLALEHITVDCQVGEITNKPIMMPNYTTSILTFKVRFWFGFFFWYESVFRRSILNYMIF